MKKKIALLLATVLLIAMVLSTGMASALADKTVYLQYYDYYNPTLQITDYTLSPAVTLKVGESISYTSITSYGYNIVGYKTGTPPYITYNDSYNVMYLLVTRKSDTSVPTSTYYYGTGKVVYLGNSDYVYESIELANPLPTLTTGAVCPLTSNHLGGLSPSNTHLTFATSNSTIAYTIGAVLYGSYPGTAKLNVYYDGRLVIIKDITVVGYGVTPTPTYGNSIVTADDNLIIGPASFNALKGRSYKFTRCYLNGVIVSPTKLRWESSNTSIATVSKSGVVRTRKVGSVVITAETTDGENSASVEFIVK